MFVGQNLVKILILEVNMKDYQSKFSNKKSNLESGKKSGSSTISGCCCGSHYSEEVEEVEIKDTEDK